MAGDKDSGDKTEKATPKKLKDAKEKGEVAKSKDITNTVLLVVAAIALWQLSHIPVENLNQLMDQTLSLSQDSLDHQIASLGREAVRILLLISALVFIPIIVVGLLIEFFQIGPVFTIEKMKPKMEHMNPVAGLKRMFSLDSLFELAKSILKTAVIFSLAGVAIIQFFPNFLMLSTQNPDLLADQLKSATLTLVIWTCIAFVFISALDTIWQKHSFAKKMKMSRRDMKQEHKDMEGDPHMKSHRKQTAMEWAQQGAASAAKDASVLVVNPTHIAIAINYDKQNNPVPTVTAQGEMDTAVIMRESAEEAQVPILRNQQLARTLLANTEEGDFIPHELFDIVAEVILWATQVKKTLVDEAQGSQIQVDVGEDSPIQKNTRPTPGEDLTRYAS